MMQLTERDKKIIQLLTENGWVTAPVLQGLFPSRQAFNVRIKKLIDHKIVHSFLLMDHIRYINCPPMILQQFQMTSPRMRVFRLNHIHARKTGNANRNLAQLRLFAHQMMLESVLKSFASVPGLSHEIQQFHDMKRPDAILYLNGTKFALEIERSFKRPISKLHHKTSKQRLPYHEYINGLLMENDRVLYVIQNKTDLKRFLKIPGLSGSTGFALFDDLKTVYTVKKKLTTQEFLDGTR